MNILFFCSEYPPAVTGGIGSVTKIIAEELVRRGHNIYVIGYYPKNNKLPQYSTINGVNIYRLNLGYRQGNFKNLIFKILNKIHLSHFIIKKEVTYTENFIDKIIKKKNIDILELTDYYSFNNSTKPLPFKKFTIPTILKIHGCMSFINSLKGTKYTAEAINDALHFSRCDYISAVSNYSLQYIQNNFDVDHFLGQNVIYNPLEDSFLNQTPPSNKKNILFIGKITETKGCYSLLKAFNIIAVKYTDWELTLIGGGNMEEAKNYICPTISNRVHFLGFCNREQIKAEIDKCAFACIPTYFENFSMVALEIMARQKALIFTNRTSGPEVITHNIDGLLVDPENIEEIATSISNLINDSILRNKLAENAYIKVKNNFTTSTICDKIEKEYNMIKRYHLCSI